MLSWLGVILFAVVVLGFCGYEVHWKLSRLNGDLERLAGLGEQLTQLQGDFAATAERASAIHDGTAVNGSAANSTAVNSTAVHATAPSTAVTRTAG
ncbi:hypothetical protein SAMN05444157_2356 [Frankineae bacterium MT45]|nr:hypothetical protein SAMN05444157_2356 [Frankineae bacterium MT45]